jgi:hypothetical protein
MRREVYVMLRTTRGHETGMEWNGHVDVAQGVRIFGRGVRHQCIPPLSCEEVVSDKILPDGRHVFTRKIVSLITECFGSHFRVIVLGRNNYS